MSRNILYANDIATAARFIEENKENKDFMNFIRRLQTGDYSHSDRWSMAYDYLHENFFGKESYATGIAYYCEE